MGKPQAIRNRKNEMISCWVCTAFVAIVFSVMNFLLNVEALGVFNVAVSVLFIVWILISLFYTFQYLRWKKSNNR